MPDILYDIWNVLLMVIGFSLVIVVHELGHFIAARWAGIRVHAFAVGFGQAICSWRKGLGLRLGSSEQEYAGLLADQGKTITSGHLEDIAETEYRLNWIPFGGYVRMLGQEDGSPGATSSAPDSYTSKPVWKRMIVISGGVVMNVILAAILFMVVFLAGMKEMPPVAGPIVPNSPAAVVGLQTGDVVVEINGRRAQTFSDVAIASAMSGPEKAIELDILRDGERLTLSPVPRKGEMAMKTIGMVQPISATLIQAERGAPREALTTQFRSAGLEGVEPGMTLVAIDGEDLEPRSLPGGVSARFLAPLREAARTSGGRPIPVTFRAEHSDQTVQTHVQPSIEFQSAATLLGEAKFPFDHLLGITPLMRAGTVQPRGTEQGLHADDVFLRVADADYPSIPQAISVIRANAGKSIDVLVLRDDQEMSLRCSVGDDGRIGFTFAPALDTPIVATPPPLADSEPLAAAMIEPPLVPGARIESINQIPVSSFRDIRRATQSATATGDRIAMLVRSPGAPQNEPTTHSWTLTSNDIESIQGLGWRLSPGLEMQFQWASITLKASNPWQGVVMGVQKTHRIMTLTYLTFKRLVQGTVSPKELRGPVGITHIGSQVVRQGFIYLLFFLALISANLAVINFLPIPVVDGGHFVMLAYEGIAQRPVPIIVQNVATVVGLALILTAFIYVTINDIARFF